MQKLLGPQDTHMRLGTSPLLSTPLALNLDYVEFPSSAKAACQVITRRLSIADVTA